MKQAAAQHAEVLSQVEQEALQQYSQALQPWEVLDVTHTHEGYLVVVTKAASDEEEQRLLEKMTQVGTTLLLDTGVYILLEHQQEESKNPHGS
jgi:nitrate reductase NapAB chaperone NapD